jgi:hypothetical protein
MSLETRRSTILQRALSSGREAKVQPEGLGVKDWIILKQYLVAGNGQRRMLAAS